MKTDETILLWASLALIWAYLLMTWAEFGPMWLRVVFNLVGAAGVFYMVYLRRKRGISFRWSFKGLSREQRLRAVRVYGIVALMIFGMAAWQYVKDSPVDALPAVILGLFFVAMGFLAWRGYGGQSHD